MSKMTFTSPRATLEETMAFANAVRAAGGGNPLDALLPSVPSDSSQCLIARNLNFNCQVNTGRNDEWCMTLESESLRDSIAEALGLDTLDISFRYAVVLPPEIGQVAADFDDVTDVLDTLSFQAQYPDEEQEEFSEEELQRARDFYPFIEASVLEAYSLATYVNDRGELVL